MKDQSNYRTAFVEKSCQHVRLGETCLKNIKSQRKYGTAVFEKSCWQDRLGETSVEISKINVIMVRQLLKKAVGRLRQVKLAWKYEK